MEEKYSDAVSQIKQVKVEKRRKTSDSLAGYSHCLFLIRKFNNFKNVSAAWLEGKEAKDRKLLWIPLHQNKQLSGLFCAAVLFEDLSPYIQPIFYFLAGLLFDLREGGTKGILTPHSPSLGGTGYN